VGGKCLRESRPTSQEYKVFLSWGNRMRWLEAEADQRTGKEGHEVSRNLTYCVQYQATLLKSR